MANLKTTREVIGALGGVKSVAALTGRKYTAAHNWLGFETFPADTYTVMSSALMRVGKTAPASLWRQVEPAARAAS